VAPSRYFQLHEKRTYTNGASPFSFAKYPYPFTSQGEYLRSINAIERYVTRLCRYQSGGQRRVRE